MRIRIKIDYAKMVPDVAQNKCFLCMGKTCPK